MRIKEFIYNILFIVFLPAAVITASGRTSEDTLAVIGSKVIYSRHYADLYKNKIIKIGLTDNIETRREFLQNLVRDELLIRDAYNRNLDRSAFSQREYRRIYLQELLNAWSDTHISPELNITEDILKDLFFKLNTKIKVRHLYAADRNSAYSVYKQLMNGKDFNELAAEIFRDPVLKNNGGSLGYITVDEMDPYFESAAFSLRPGEISLPVKTVQGYSIIKVDDIVRNPLITENEYLKSRERLKAFARKRNYEQKTKEYIRELGSKLSIQFNDNLIEKLYASLNEGTLTNLVESSDLITEDDLNENVLTSSEGSWNLRILIEEMSIVTEKQLKWIHNTENLKDFISGLYFRKYISEMALKEELDKTASFSEKVSYAFDTHLLMLIEDDLKSGIKISEDSVRSYYNKNIALFKTKPEIRLSSILLNSSQVADSVKQLLEKNSFEELAGKFSIQTLTAEKGGDIGYYRKEDLDHLGDEIFTIKPGEWKGPIKDNDKYVFLKCTDFREPQIRSFAECAPEIEEMLKTFRWYEVRDEYILLLKNEITVQVFSGKLNNLKLNMTE